MKKIIFSWIFIAILVMALSACGSYEFSPNDMTVFRSTSDTLSLDGVLDVRPIESDVFADFVLHQHDSIDESSDADTFVTPSVEASFMYMTFEEAVTSFATDVVIAQYVGSRPFGTSLTEFEFIVLDRILGYAADRIFVYADNDVSVDVFGTELSVSYMPGNLMFIHGTTYMLPLIRVSRAHTNIQDEGFTFIRDIVINLDNPAMSRMYSEDLFSHSSYLDFDTMNFARADITSFLVSYVADLTRYNTPSRGIISSSAIETVVYESPYILLIEIGNPLRLSNEQANTDLMATDLFYITIISALKGNVVTTYDTVMIFVADTVSQGERHVVAVEPISKGSSWFQLTSRISLFSAEQTNEVTQILSQ